MNLRLDDIFQPHREFYGTNTVQMPKLIADGRIPMSVAGIMQRRLDVRNASVYVKNDWMDNHFDTGDAVVYHPNGRVKIVLDSEDLREMTPDTLRNNGALILTEEVYNALQGEEFERGEFGKVNERLSRDEVKFHPGWKALARDQALLNAYTDFIFAEVKEKSGYDDAMGIYIGSTNRGTPEMLMWCVSRINSSNANGGYILNGTHGRLVGV